MELCSLSEAWGNSLSFNISAKSSNNSLHLSIQKLSTLRWVEMQLLIIVIWLTWKKLLCSQVKMNFCIWIEFLCHDTCFPFSMHFIYLLHYQTLTSKINSIFPSSPPKLNLVCGNSIQWPILSLKQNLKMISSVRFPA